MTLDEAIKQATEHAKAHNLTAYIHTDSTLGHNFRFMRPIEDVPSDHRKARTVATVSPAGEVTRLESFDDYVKALWPANVANECIGALEEEDNVEKEDCLEQNRDESHQCDSCRTYSRLAADWEERKT